MHTLLRARRSGLALLALGLAGCGSPVTGGAPPPPHVRVEVAAATEVADSDDLVASVRSRASTDVRPHVSGFVTEIAVAPGATVTAGQVLVRLDASPQAAAVSRARAATSTAATAVDRAQAETTALAVQEQARLAEVTYARAQRDRAEALFARGAMTADEHERATSQFDAAEAQHAAVVAQLDAAHAAVASARSLASESTSSLREGQAQLAYYAVTAPIDGRLGDIPVHVGDLVDPSTLLTTLEGREGFELAVQVPVELASRLREGLEVLALSSAGETVAQTRIAFVSPRVDTTTQTVLVTCELDPSSALRIGQFTRARVIWERREGLTVPTTAILRINTQPFVFVVAAGDPETVTQRPVRVGSLYEQRYVVLDGLAPGERVVTAGVQRLSDGGAISVEQASDVAAAPAHPGREG